METASRRRTILIVDQDDAVRGGLARSFEAARYTVLGAKTFRAGQAVLKEQRPDVLVTEIRLGEFNGLQYLLTNDPPASTVVLTAYDDPTLEAQARQLGAEFVLKPSSADAILQIIDRMRPRSSAASADQDNGRRWVRKRPKRDLLARIADRHARVLNVSYGGLCFEMERGGGRATSLVVQDRSAG
jgi:DNA-binding NtrC family response regulator